MAPKILQTATRSFVLFLLVALGFAALPALDAGAQPLPGPVYEITGKVFGPDGMALSGAAVELTKDDGTHVKDATTDANGKYTFAQQTAGTYFILASHDCCQRSGANVTADGVTLTATAPDIHLAKKDPPQSGDAVTLSGTVKDTETKKPVALVRIEIYNFFYKQPAECSGQEVCAAYVEGGSQYFTVESDANGAFEIEVNRGDLSLTTYKDGYDTTQGSLSIQDNRTVEIPVRQSSQETVRVFGTVKSSMGGPIAGANVDVGPDYNDGCCYESAKPMPASEDGQWTFQSSAQQWNSTQTKEDGSYEMNVAPGDLRVSVYHEKHLQGVRTVDATGQKEVRVDFVLERIPDDTVSVTGRITDAVSGDGIAFADVSFENQKWGTYGYAQTDKDGFYKVAIKPGYTIMTVSAYKQYYRPCDSSSTEPEPASDNSSGASIREGEPYPGPACEPGEREFDFFPRVMSFVAQDGEARTADAKLSRRAPPTSVFQGYVLNETNQEPVIGAQVTFFNEATRDWGSATTDKDGSYKIKVHAGYYTVRVWAEHFFDAVENVEIAAEETYRLDIEMTPGEKRYGYMTYYGRGGYAVADASAPEKGASDSGGPSPPMMATASPSPSQPDGQNAYVGSEGGLGPYQAGPEGPIGGGGSAPGASLLALVAMAALAVFVVRRRA